MAVKSQNASDLLAEEFKHLWEKRDLEYIMGHYVKGYQTNTRRAGESGPLGSREAYRDLIAEWQSGFSDAEVTIDELVSEDDVAMAHWFITGTHDGEFRGMRPTNKKINVHGFSMRKYEDGKVAQSADEMDYSGVLEQLGVE